jgi:hypothetical protein
VQVRGKIRAVGEPSGVGVGKRDLPMLSETKAAAVLTSAVLDCTG